MTTVYVLAADQVRRSVLLRRAQVERTEDPAKAIVIVAFGETVDEALLLFQRDRRCAGERLVIVADSVAPTAVYRAVRAGVCAVLHHDDADQERLTRAIRAAATGEGGMPCEAVSRLLDGTDAGPADERLTEREVHLLRLVADGYGNADIARHLKCSPHTVKNMIHDLMTRLHLRNRTHAAAFAVRSGLA